MEWIEKYSDFDELRKSKLAIFFKENKSVQHLKQTLYWLSWGLGVACIFISIAFKEWTLVAIFSFQLAYRLINRKRIKSFYLSNLGMAMFLMASFLMMLHFMQRS